MLKRIGPLLWALLLFVTLPVLFLHNETSPQAPTLTPSVTSPPTAALPPTESARTTITAQNVAQLHSIYLGAIALITSINDPQGTCDEGVSYIGAEMVDQTALPSIDGYRSIYHDVASKIELDAGEDVGQIGDVAISPDNRSLAAVTAEAAVWLNLRTGQAQPVYNPWPRAVSFSPDGSVLALMGSESELMQWTSDSGDLTNILPSTNNTWQWIGFGADRRRLVSWVDDLDSNEHPQRLVVAEYPTGQHVADLPFNGPAPQGCGFQYTAAFSPDLTQVAAVDKDGMLDVWTLNPVKLEMTADDLEASKIQFTPDGKSLLLLCDDNHIRAVDIASQQVTEPTGATAFALNSDGSLLATAAGNQVQVWDMQNWQVVGTLTASMDNITALDFSPDGSLLAGGGEDGKLQLWGAS